MVPKHSTDGDASVDWVMRHWGRHAQCVTARQLVVFDLNFSWVIGRCALNLAERQRCSIRPITSPIIDTCIRVHKTNPVRTVELKKVKVNREATMEVFRKQWRSKREVIFTMLFFQLCKGKFTVSVWLLKMKSVSLMWFGRYHQVWLYHNCLLLTASPT